MEGVEESLTAFSTTFSRYDPAENVYLIYCVKLCLSCFSRGASIINFILFGGIINFILFYGIYIIYIYNSFIYNFILFGEIINFTLFWASLVAQLVKNPLAMQETWVRSLGWEDPLERRKGTHSRILAWRIPWTV